MTSAAPAPPKMSRDGAMIAAQLPKGVKVAGRLREKPE
jgi:hypothetical protein